MSTQQTIELLKGMKPIRLAEDIAKAFSQSTGLVNYDLEPYAKVLYPVNTPLRNRIPRVKANGGTATNWKQITKVNAGMMRAGVSEGNRGGIITNQVQDRTAAYRGLGLENFYSNEADYAAQGFDDVRAQDVRSLLDSFFIQEERTILGGNGTLALGTPTTPTLAALGSGGSLTAGALSVIVVGLTLVAHQNASVSAGVQPTFTRTNAEGTTDVIKSGASNKSAAATVTVVAGDSISATTSVINGAVSYAWYAGVAGSERLVAITTTNSALITATNATSQLASAIAAADDSRDTLVFDGLLTQILTPGSGAVVMSLPTGTPGVGSKLTSDGAGGIVEIDDMFQQFWDQSRLSPDEIQCSSRSLLAINRIVISNGGAPLIRFSNESSGAQINAGSVVGTYLNKITNKQVKIAVHPDMCDGTLLFWSNGIPYALSNVGNILQMKMRQDYYQSEWPIRTRRREFGIYTDGLLQCYFPPAFGVLRNFSVAP